MNRDSFSAIHSDFRRFLACKNYSSWRLTAAAWQSNCRICIESSGKQAEASDSEVPVVGLSVDLNLV